MPSHDRVGEVIRAVNPDLFKGSLRSYPRLNYSLPLGYSGARRATNRDQGTACSISARNLSRRVCFFLPTYSTCEKLPCRCLDLLPLPKLRRFYPQSTPERDFSA